MRIEELESAVRGLLQEKRKLECEIDELAAKNEQFEDELEEWKTNNERILRNQRLKFLLERIHPSAANLPEATLLGLFPENQGHPTYVMSIDIRRSTDLMLKAREPKKFAQFISDLSHKLRLVVIDNLGVFDKFTGDGILAFFPESYSGEDAGFRVIKAASECHSVFESVYTVHRESFIAVPLDTGLGIGIDYGDVNFIQIGDDLTVVGTPVVFACRMGGAPAGSTFLNPPAFYSIFKKFSEFCQFEETRATFKNDGEMLAFAARLNGKPRESRKPSWVDSERVN